MGPVRPQWRHRWPLYGCHFNQHIHIHEPCTCGPPQHVMSQSIDALGNSANLWVLNDSRGVMLLLLLPGGGATLCGPSVPAPRSAKAHYLLGLLILAF